MTTNDSIKRPAIYNAIACTCGVIFSPKNSKQKLCSWRCRFKEIFARSEKAGDCIEWPMKPGGNGYGQFTIDAIRSDNQQTLKVYSSNGQLVRNEIIPIGVERMTLSLDKVASGLYLIRIESSVRVQELRYIKQ